MAMDFGMSPMAIAWAMDGSLTVAGAIERTPDPTRLLDLNYPFDQDFWVGRASDAGLSWTTSMLDPRTPYVASLASMPSGEVVLAWSGTGYGLNLSMSRDAGSTWGRPWVVPWCVYPDYVQPWQGRALIGCGNTGLAPSVETQAVLLDLAQDSIDVFSVSKNEDCLSAGPVAAGPRMVVLLQCNETFTLRASTDGRTWTRWGTWPEGIAGDVPSIPVGLAATSEGALVALMQYIRYVGVCGCEARVQLAAWDSEGSIMHEETVLVRSHADLDHPEDVLGGVHARTSVAQNATLMLLPVRNGLGWIHSAAAQSA